MAPYSSTLAWKIPWMEEPGRLQSIGSLRVGHDWATSLSLFTFHFHALEKEMATHSSVLAWRISGMAEPGGLPSMGSHRVGHDWRDLAAAAAAAAADYSFPYSTVSQNFPGKNTGVSCYSLFQGIFPTQGLNLRLLHWQKDSLPLNHLGSHDSSEKTIKG